MNYCCHCKAVSLRQLAVWMTLTVCHVHFLDVQLTAAGTELQLEKLCSMRHICPRLSLMPTLVHSSLRKNLRPTLCSFMSDHLLGTRFHATYSHRTSPLVWGRGTPLPPLSIYFLIFSPFYFSLSFIGFTYFLLLSIPFLFTRIVPLRFQAGGRWRRPNLGLVCVLLCGLCYLYSLVKMYSDVLFYFV